MKIKTAKANPIQVEALPTEAKKAEVISDESILASFDALLDEVNGDDDLEFTPSEAEESRLSDLIR